MDGIGEDESAGAAGGCFAAASAASLASLAALALTASNRSSSATRTRHCSMPLSGPVPSRGIFCPQHPAIAGRAREDVKNSATRDAAVHSCHTCPYLLPFEVIQFCASFINLQDVVLK